MRDRVARLVSPIAVVAALLLVAGCGARVSLGDVDDFSSDASAGPEYDGGAEASELDEDAESGLDAASFDEPQDDASIEDADSAFPADAAID